MLPTDTLAQRVNQIHLHPDITHFRCRVLLSTKNVHSFLSLSLYLQFNGNMPATFSCEMIFFDFITIKPVALNLTDQKTTLETFKIILPYSG